MRRGRDGDGNGTVDCDMTGRYRDREIGTGSWTDMHIMDCGIIKLRGFMEPNSVKLSLRQS